METPRRLSGGHYQVQQKDRRLSVFIEHLPYHIAGANQLILYIRKPDVHPKSVLSGGSERQLLAGRTAINSFFVHVNVLVLANVHQGLHLKTAHGRGNHAL